jgi:hypothetical protein
MFGQTSNFLVRSASCSLISISSLLLGLEWTNNNPHFVNISIRYVLFFGSLLLSASATFPQPYLNYYGTHNIFISLLCHMLNRMVLLFRLCYFLISHKIYHLP